MENSTPPTAQSEAQSAALPPSIATSDLPKAGVPPNPPLAPVDLNALPNTAPLVRLPPKPRSPLPRDLVFGTIDFRTPAEDIEFAECEALVGQGWAQFARAGEALARIRDKELYRNEFVSFEVYCRQRWGFGRSKVFAFMSAAQIYKSLAALPGVPMPQCESQVRPLVSLSSDLAQQVWVHALGLSPEGIVPARLVKRAAQEVLKPDQAAIKTEAATQRKQRSRLRPAVRTGFKELLTLLMGNAERDVVIAKVQEIERLLEPLLGPRKPKV